MNYYKIDTDRMHLVACDKDLMSAALYNTRELSNLLQAEVPSPWTHFDNKPFEYALQQITQSPEETTWWTYFPVHKAHRKMIGTCGYKGKPDDAGVVEIGYEVIDEYQHQGLATEIATALIGNAFKDKRVEIVQAHTLAEKNASAHILKKCGMAFIKELTDEEDGTIWQWQLNKADYVTNKTNKKQPKEKA